MNGMTYDPDFDIDNEVLRLVSDISALAVRIADGLHKAGTDIRRGNRLRSIRSSLAI